MTSEVSEFHTPEFHSSVRVAADGTVTLPLAGQLKVAGMTEQAASTVIEKALVEGGIGVEGPSIKRTEITSSTSPTKEALNLWQ